MDEINQFMQLATDLKIKGLATDHEKEDTEVSNEEYHEKSIEAESKEAIQYTCEMCHYTSFNKQSMEEHSEEKHSNTLPCNLCEYKCNKKSRMTENMNSERKDKINYSC